MPNIENNARDGKDSELNDIIAKEIRIASKKRNNNFSIKPIIEIYNSTSILEIKLARVLDHLYFDDDLIATSNGDVGSYKKSNRF